MAEVLSSRELNRALLARQGLLQRLTVPIPDAVEHLVGLQAQSPNAPYFGLWSRVQGFTTGELAELLTGRQLVRTALMRSTVHLVSGRDACSLRFLLAPMLERQLLAGSPWGPRRHGPRRTGRGRP